jgi:hypothetical protein
MSRVSISSAAALRIPRDWLRATYWVICRSRLCWISRSIVVVDAGALATAGNLPLYQHLLHRLWRFERQLRERTQIQRQREQRFQRGVIRMAVQPAGIQAIARRGQLGIDDVVVAVRIRRGRRSLQSPRRILRNDGQRQRLRQTQRGRRFIEVGQTGRADAFDVAAVRRVVEISLENLPLRIEQLQLHGARDLLELAQRRTRIEFPQQPGQLHGDRSSRPADRRGAHRSPMRRAPVRKD